MVQQPSVSIIIPVHNAAQYLDRCLTAIKGSASNCSSCEIIVVDDGSKDTSAQIVQSHGVHVLRLKTQSGPAAARNRGASKANGSILFFVDSDVLIRPDTISRVQETFYRYPDVAAVFGSYDDDPAEKNFISQYKNLLHHFIHQKSCCDAVTFWAGCGAVRKEIFAATGGFDQYKYCKPCIEDIELGFRMTSLGFKTILDKGLQVKHLKKWDFKSLILTDILSRAIPWTKLMLEQEKILNDLNLKMSQKVSAALTGLTALTLFLLPFETFLIPFPFILLITVITLNHQLLRFFLNRNGWTFAARAFSMHLLYFLYSGAIFVIYWMIHQIRSGGKHLSTGAEVSWKS